jgi:hypothetical protein
MSNASKLKNEFSPVSLSFHAKDCYELANTAITRALCCIPQQYKKYPVKVKIRMFIEDIFDVYGVSSTYDEIYNSLNPQNKVLANGIFFKEFFYEYAANLNTNLNDTRIQPTVYQKSEPLTVKDETELKKLLENARQLIPVIYTTRWCEKQLVFKSETVKEPAFVPNSLRARFVSNAQIGAVRKLHNIFEQVVNMTTK